MSQKWQPHPLSTSPLRLHVEIFTAQCCVLSLSLARSVCPCHILPPCRKHESSHSEWANRVKNSLVVGARKKKKISAMIFLNDSHLLLGYQAERRLELGSLIQLMVKAYTHTYLAIYLSIYMEIYL